MHASNSQVLQFVPATSEVLLRNVTSVPCELEWLVSGFPGRVQSKSSLYLLFLMAKVSLVYAKEHFLVPEAVHKRNQSILGSSLSKCPHQFSMAGWTIQLTRLKRSAHEHEVVLCNQHLESGCSVDSMVPDLHAQLSSTQNFLHQICSCLCD